MGYNLDIMRQTACQVFNLIIVDSYATLFRCTVVVRASDSMTSSKVFRSLMRFNNCLCLDPPLRSSTMQTPCFTYTNNRIKEVVNLNVLV